MKFNTCPQPRKFSEIEIRMQVKFSVFDFPRARNGKLPTRCPEEVKINLDKNYDDKLSFKYDIHKNIAIKDISLVLLLEHVRHFNC